MKRRRRRRKGTGHARTSRQNSKVMNGKGTVQDKIDVLAVEKSLVSQEIKLINILLLIKDWGVEVICGMSSTVKCGEKLKRPRRKEKRYSRRAGHLTASR